MKARLAAVWLDDWGNTVGLKEWLYPDEASRDERDPVRLAESRDLMGMSVYLDCGDEDSYKFYEGAEALYDVLQSRGFASEYHHSPGGHDGDYWSGHARDYLQFYVGN